MSEPISEVVKRYTEDQYRYGRSDKGRIRDQVALAEFCCRVVPDLLAACDAARQTLDVAIRSGLSGFSEAETDEMVNNHVTIKLIDAALAKARGAK